MTVRFSVLCCCFADGCDGLDHLIVSMCHLMCAGTAALSAEISVAAWLIESVRDASIVARLQAVLGLCVSVCLHD